MVGDPINVCMHEALVPAFKEWLRKHELELTGPLRQTYTEADIGEETEFFFVTPTDAAIARIEGRT